MREDSSKKNILSVLCSSNSILAPSVSLLDISIRIKDIFFVSTPRSLTIDLGQKNTLNKAFTYVLLETLRINTVLITKTIYFT